MPHLVLARTARVEMSSSYPSFLLSSTSSDPTQISGLWLAPVSRKTPADLANLGLLGSGERMSTRVSPEVVLEDDQGLLLFLGQQLPIVTEQLVVEEHLLALLPGGHVVQLVVVVVWQKW